MVVVVKTAGARYAIRRTDVFSMCLVSGDDDLRALGTPERPALPVELGALLRADDTSAPGRRHGLAVQRLLCSKRNIEGKYTRLPQTLSAG